MCLMLDQFLWGHSSHVCDISCYFTNSVDPDEMQSPECSIMLHFILVFTVSKSFHSGFPEYKGLINVINGFFSDYIK